MIGYINSYCTISRLDSFSSGILESKNEIFDEVQHPNYKEQLPAGLGRRMGSILKMSVAAALRAKGDHDLGGIIVGTALGCFDQTDKFLSEQVRKKDGGLLAPTAFILSTHNTIAGQIGLILKNHGFNSTHTNRGSSFETALINALIQVNDGAGKMLLGGVDEKTDLLDELIKKSNSEAKALAAGASFFVLSKDPSEDSIQILNSQVVHEFDDVSSTLKQFLDKTDFSPDAVLYGNSSPIQTESFLEFNDLPVINYSDLAGGYSTNSAFGMQMGTEMIQSTQNSFQSILLVNNFANRSLGLICLKKP